MNQTYILMIGYYDLWGVVGNPFNEHQQLWIRNFKINENPIIFQIKSPSEGTSSSEPYYLNSGGDSTNEGTSLSEPIYFNSGEISTDNDPLFMSILIGMVITISLILSFIFIKNVNKNPPVKKIKGEEISTISLQNPIQHSNYMKTHLENIEDILKMENKSVSGDTVSFKTKRFNKITCSFCSKICDPTSIFCENCGNKIQ